MYTENSHFTFPATDITQIRPVGVINGVLLIDHAGGALIDDTLTITCDLLIEESDLTNTRTDKTYSECPLRLQQDLAQLINNKKSSDVIFKFGEKELYAHRNILAARSSYFEAMFEHDTIESQYSAVEVTDISSGVFREMLTFLYVGRASYDSEQILFR